MQTHRGRGRRLLDLNGSQYTTSSSASPFFFFFLPSDGRSLRKKKKKPKTKKRLPDFFLPAALFPFSRPFLGARVLFGCWSWRLKGPQCSSSPYHVTFDLFGQRDQQTLGGRGKPAGISATSEGRRGHAVQLSVNVVAT